MFPIFFLVAILTTFSGDTGKISDSASPRVWDFESDAPGPLASEWTYPKDRGVLVQVVSEGAILGRQCVVLTSGIDRKLAADGEVVINNGGFFLVRKLDAAPYRGRTIRLSAWLKLEAPAYGATGTGHLLLEVQRRNQPASLSDVQQEQPLRTTVWTQVETVGAVAEDAERIILGTRLMNGYGRLWVDDLTIEIVP